MSLQIWLPLTKDLRQQGLSDTVITNHGAIFDSNGKLGGCYSFDGTNDNLSYTPSVDGIETLSIAFWVCPTAATPAGSFFSLERNTYWQLTFYGDHVAIRDNSVGYSGTRKNFSTGTYIANTWTHVVVTYDKGTLKIYRDGSLLSTNSVGGTKLNTSINNARIGSAVQSGYYYSGKMNDVRIYDNCLSPMEVKELAKGLVLHYSLADTYVEATTNLITTEDCLSSTCYNGATSKYGYGANTDIYKTVTTYDGRKGTKVYMGTNGNNCYPYVYINGMYTSNGTNSPEYKTLSFDYYTTVSTSICPYRLGSGTATATYIVNANGTERTGTGTNSVTIPIVPNTWNHVEVTFHGTTDADAQWGYIQNQPAHVSNTNNFWFFANMQLETKDHATGYAGVGGTRNSNIIYDTSGFCNNGTISGALTISNDTPKYKASTYMSKSALITHPRPVFGGTDQEWTCAMWVKLDTVNQSGIAMNNFNYGNNIVHAANSTPLLYLNAGTNDYYNYGNKAVSAGVWTHVVFVFRNSDATKLIYINGVEQTNKSGPNRTSTPSGIQDVVTVGTNLTGYISDYRVYATALSPSDVKSLYQNCATIDPDGTIRGQIRS